MTGGNFCQYWSIGQDPQFCLQLLHGRLRRNLVKTNHSTVKKGKGGKWKQIWMLWCSNFKVQLHHTSWEKLNNRKSWTRGASQLLLKPSHWSFQKKKWSNSSQGNCKLPTDLKKMSRYSRDTRTESGAGIQNYKERKQLKKEKLKKRVWQTNLSDLANVQG